MVPNQIETFSQNLLVCLMLLFRNQINSSFNNPNVPMKVKDLLILDCWCFKSILNQFEINPPILYIRVAFLVMISTFSYMKMDFVNLLLNRRKTNISFSALGTKNIFVTADYNIQINKCFFSVNHLFEIISKISLSVLHTSCKLDGNHRLTTLKKL